MLIDTSHMLAMNGGGGFPVPELISESTDFTFKPLTNTPPEHLTGLTCRDYMVGDDMVLRVVDGTTTFSTYSTSYQGGNANVILPRFPVRRAYACDGGSVELDGDTITILGTKDITEYKLDWTTRYVGASAVLDTGGWWTYSAEPDLYTYAKFNDHYLDDVETQEIRFGVTYEQGGTCTWTFDGLWVLFHLFDIPIPD